MRRVGLIVLLCVLAAGCGPDGSAPRATVVSGSLLGTEGRPAADVAVVLLPETAVTAVEAPACLGSNSRPSQCEQAQRTTTAADGTYSFRLDGGQAPPTGYRLAAGSNDGPSLTATFGTPNGEARLPALRLWSTALDLTMRRAVRGMWSPRDVAALEEVVFLGGDGRPIWTAEGKGVVNLDARLFEDVQGTAVVESTGNVERGGTTFRVTYRTAGVPFAGSAGIPPSRQAACTPTPCGLTDGDPLTPGTPPAAREATVDLAQSTAVSFIVVRACPRVCEVQMSVDGLAWKVVGSGDIPYFFVTPAVGPAIRYVRVRSVSDLDGLAEVSVW